MEIDKILYKEILGRETSFCEKKDCTTMIAIHYLLNRNNIYDKSRIALEFELTEDGLDNPKWVTSIRAKELVSDFAPRKINVRAQIILDSIKYATNQTAREYEMGQRTMLMAMAGLAYLRENVYSENETAQNKEKIFDEKMPFFKGMYKMCAKGLKRIASYKKKLREEKQKAE